MDLFEVGVQEQNKVVLKNFTIKNYRGIEEAYHDVNERGIVFTGESGVGKTSRIEALLWLLTGRLFDGSVNTLQDYIMPKSSTQETILEVTATFNHGMEDFVFTKQMSQKWTKKRGTEELMYEGVNITYYVNGVAKSTVKEYNKLLYRVFGLEQASNLIEDKTKLLSKVDLMMLFTVLDFFPSLDNKTLRELVLLVGGDVEIKDLDMSDTLRGVLKTKSYDLDDLKKVIKLKLKGDKNNIGLHTQKQTLEAQLQGYEKTIVTLGVVDDVEKMSQELETNRNEQAKLRVKLEQSEQELVQDYDTQIAKLELELNELANKKTNEESEELAKLEEERQSLRDDYLELKNELNENKTKIASINQSVLHKESEVALLKSQGKRLIEERKAIQEHRITCPHCNQSFTLDEHGQKIEKITHELKELKEKIEVRNNDIKELAKTEIELNREIERLSIKLDDLTQNGNVLSENIEHKRRSVLSSRGEVFTGEHELSIMEELKRLKNTKNDVSLNMSINKVKIKTQITNLETREQEILRLLGNVNQVENTKKEIGKAHDEIKTIQKEINTLEQLEMEIKILEEQWLQKIDENIKNAFGENIQFKMFETNLSNDNLAPTCEMYVKDQFGNWVNAINGINTGHSVPRLVEFLTIVKHKLGIYDGILLIDFFESIGSEPLKELLTYNQQMIATSVKRGQEKMEIEEL